jgi:hypothetical protein
MNALTQIFEVKNSAGKVIAIFRPKAVMKVVKTNNKKADKIVTIEKVQGPWINNMPISAEINLTAKTIRIWGLYTNRNTPQTFDRTFKIGDTVEIDSYNYSYTGPIKNITKGYIECLHHTKVKRLRICEFVSRNWDLDLEVIAKNNFETSMYI